MAPVHTSKLADHSACAAYSEGCFACVFLSSSLGARSSLALSLEGDETKATPQHGEPVEGLPEGASGGRLAAQSEIPRAGGS
ncbi:hypothetical protein MRX96_021118 [Rhipicephalus microplus]